MGHCRYFLPPWLSGAGRSGCGVCDLMGKYCGCKGSPRSSTIKLVAACAIFWLATGLFLLKFTTTDVPWWDAFPTALSIVATVLLGRKYIENWPLWIAVNIVGMALFAYKGLWLTVGLYGVFAVMAAMGWRAWRSTTAWRQHRGRRSMIIALLGAESTGKSALAHALAQHLQNQGTDAVAVDEYLREWCEQHQRTPHIHEQAHIAATQSQRIATAAAQAPRGGGRHHGRDDGRVQRVCVCRYLALRAGAGCAAAHRHHFAHRAGYALAGRWHSARRRACAWPGRRAAAPAPRRGPHWLPSGLWTG